MRWILATIVGLGAVVGAATTPVMAAAAPGPGAKAAMPDTSQVEKVHRRHRHGGFGGFGIYVGPSWGGYYPYYGSSYYDDDYGYYPRYRYRRGWGHRHYRHRHHRHHRRHWH